MTLRIGTAADLLCNVVLPDEGRGLFEVRGLQLLGAWEIAENSPNERAVPWRSTHGWKWSEITAKENPTSSARAAWAGSSRAPLSSLESV